jgi:hypothetical protein
VTSYFDGISVLAIDLVGTLIYKTYGRTSTARLGRIAPLRV